LATIASPRILEYSAIQKIIVLNCASYGKPPAPGVAIPNLSLRGAFFCDEAIQVAEEIAHLH